MDDFKELVSAYEDHCGVKAGFFDGITLEEMKTSAAFPGFGDYVAGWTAAMAVAAIPAPEGECGFAPLSEIAACPHCGGPIDAPAPKAPAEIKAKADNDSANAYADGWNACRRAMLAASPAAPAQQVDPLPCTWSRCITHGCDGFCERAADKERTHD